MKKTIVKIISKILVITLVAGILNVPLSTEAASVEQTNAMKIGKKSVVYSVVCSYGIKGEKGTWKVKLSDKNKVTIAASICGWEITEKKIQKNCLNLFGENISIKVLPYGKKYDTQNNNYGNIENPIYRFGNGKFGNNFSDWGDHYPFAELKGFKKKGNTYILKTNDYCGIFGYKGKKHKFAETTYRLKKCNKSKYGLKIIGIKVKKVSDFIPEYDNGKYIW